MAPEPLFYKTKGVIDSKGRVTIDKPMLDMAGLKTGDIIEKRFIGSPEAFTIAIVRPEKK